MSLRRLQVFAGLPWREQVLFAGYLAATAGLEVALRFVPPGRLFPAWAASARRAGGRTVSGARRQWLALRAAAIVRPGRTCLPAALLLWRETLSEGTAARLVIGVRTAPEFMAHAWVEGPDATILTVGRAPDRLTALAVWQPDGSLLPSRRGTVSARSEIASPAVANEEGTVA